MIERHLTLLPDESTDPEQVRLIVPHDPHAATTGSGMARTTDEACTGVRTMRTRRRFVDSKGREYQSEMVSHVYTQHETRVRFDRLSWSGAILLWQPSDSLRCHVKLLRAP